jgi:endonuclease YncB( thermonuclease family)
MLAKVQLAVVIALFLSLISIQSVPCAIDEAVGKVVSVIRGDSFAVEILIQDPRAKAIDSIKLADVVAPSTVSPEGKASSKFTESLLKGRLVLLDISDTPPDGRNEWGQLVCVAFLMDDGFRPVWPPLNRILVDSGKALLRDDFTNEFNSSSWWQKPNIPRTTRADRLKNTQKAEEESDIQSGSVLYASKSDSILKKDAKTGTMNIGYRK